MSQDISDMLGDWEYDPEANIRYIDGDDGVQKVQVRIDQGAFQGILQLNLDGRPDGKRPHGFDFALDFYRDSLDQFRSSQGKGEGDFSLDQSACEELFDEGVRVYGRYGFLMQLKDYERVVRDTELNMSLFRFVNTHAETEDDRSNLEKWWPYILRINATARAMLAVQDERFDVALNIVDEVRDRIQQLPELEAEEFHSELDRSQQALDELEQEIRRHIPLSREEELKEELQKAVELEEFERAATIRDQLIDLAGKALPGKELP